MKIACLSDLHGYLPDIPECDLLLLAGDYAPHREKEYQKRFFNEYFAPWLATQSKKREIIGVAGNHDFAFQLYPYVLPPLDWTYLQDYGTEFNGLKIWGSPWQPWFYNWAFNAYEPDLREKWELIPEDTDILLLHGPPHGYGDFTENGWLHTGSPSLTERIAHIKPKLVVCGHIHEGRGSYQLGETTIVNASYLDKFYQPYDCPITVIEL